MYIVNGIAYAGEQKQLLKIVSVRPMENYTLWLKFSSGETKYFDFAPLLREKAFSPLKDLSVFRCVYLEYGVLAWNDGAIDIAPEYLYEYGLPDCAANLPETALHKTDL
jgi:hypothetical protein